MKDAREEQTNENIENGWKEFYFQQKISRKLQSTKEPAANKRCEELEDTRKRNGITLVCGSARPANTRITGCDKEKRKNWNPIHVLRVFALVLFILAGFASKEKNNILKTKER